MHVARRWADTDVDRIYRRLNGGAWGATSKDAIRAVLHAAEAVPSTDHQGAVRERDELHEALSLFGAHTESCPRFLLFPDCTCGLDAALNGTRGQ